MWAKLDDALLDHRKVFSAGDAVGGYHGPAAALGMYAAGLLYANKHLTDGFLAEAVVRRFAVSERPLALAEALVKAGLWERVEDGYVIHDFHDWNFKASDVLAKRAEDRSRKKRQRSARSTPKEPVHG